MILEWLRILFLFIYFLFLFFFKCWHLAEVLFLSYSQQYLSAILINNHIWIRCPVPLRSWIEWCHLHLLRHFTLPRTGPLVSSFILLPRSLWSPIFRDFEKEERRIGEIRTRAARTPCERSSSRPRRPPLRILFVFHFSLFHWTFLFTFLSYNVL